MEDEISRRHNERKPPTFIYWRNPFDDVIDVYSQLATAPVVPFGDTKCMNSIVMPAEIFESVSRHSFRL